MPEGIAVRHRPGVSCPRCDQMIGRGHKALQACWQEVKTHFPDAHLSCVDRNKTDQDEAFATGHSRLQWPLSAHNRLRADGAPESVAMDLFRLSDASVAEFETPWYAEVNQWIKDQDLPLDWGGEMWPNFKDMPHFQLHKDQYE